MRPATGLSAAAAVPAVGLTGADAGVGRANAAPPYAAADGSRVDLGFVGVPVSDRQGTLLRALVDGGWVPVVASLGATADGQILNVNANTMAVHVAIAVGAARLLLAGVTPGVLDGASPPPLRSALAVLGLTLIPTVIGHTSVQTASRTLPPALVALVCPCETVGGILLGAALLGAIPTSVEIAGTGIILAGATVAILGSGDRREAG